MTEAFLMELAAMQPSQLLVSSAKLARVMAQFTPETLEPIPVKKLGSEVIITDGHTRSLAAFLRGLSEVPVVWDEDELDWEAYEICVGWCREEGIHTVGDLADRVVGPEQYEVLWHERCREMHAELKAKRTQE